MVSSLRPRKRPEHLTAKEEEATQTDSNKGSYLEELTEFLRWKQAGFKNPEQIDQYLKCYPYGLEGLHSYQKYSKYIDLAADVFRVEMKENIYEVHPSLMRCLIRRESGFLPTAISYTDAVGLGQHTDINIKEIRRRINKEGSWEQELWRAFFARVKETPEGAALLEKCMGSSTNGRPVFENESDANCPLQSIAATSIYNLLIQRALMLKSEEKMIVWSEEMDYQLSIAAAYNLGHIAASNAVDSKPVEDWIEAIVDKSTESANGDKDTELKSHINAIRNCLQSDNWKPMREGDQHVCENFDEISKPKAKN